MEDSLTSNEALLGRIAQLQRERDELQHDIEHMCMQQSGVTGSLDIIAHLQARRTGILEQELEACRHDLATCTSKNHKLQEELSEVYQIKGQFADLLKIETEKSSELEKELKFFQSRIAISLSERDRAIVEVEKIQRQKQEMIQKLHQLNERLDHISSECSGHKSHCILVQEQLERTREELQICQKVVGKFWQLRASVSGSCTSNEVQNQAHILLEDSGGSWNYAEGQHWEEEMCVQDKKIDVLASVQEELQASVVLVASLQRQLQEECTARKQAQEHIVTYKQHISGLAEFAITEMQQLQSSRVSIREEFTSMLEEEKKWFQSVSKSLKYFMEDTRISCAETIDKFEEKNLQPSGEIDKFKDIEEHINNEEACCSDLSPKGPYAGNIEHQTETDLPCDDNRSVPTVEEMLENVPFDDSKEALAQALTEKGPHAGNIGHQTETDLPCDDNRSVPTVEEMLENQVPFDDSKEALAQALTEKVAVLLLLSQQEERHLLEKNVTLALESQITELKEHLRQVTSEKVNALLELAQLRERFRELQDHERNLTQEFQNQAATNASAQLLPALWTGTKPQRETSLMLNEETGERKSVPKGYLRSWLRGLDLSISKSRANSQSLASENISKKTDESFSVARLRVENAGLQECLSSIQHLTKAASRLRLTIMGAAAESSNPNECSIQKYIDIVNNAITEVHHLKMAFCISMPVSSTGSAGTDSPTQGHAIVLEDTDSGTPLSPDVASTFGMEIIELLNSVAELQKASLIQKLNAVMVL